MSTGIVSDIILDSDLIGLLEDHGSHHITFLDLVDLCYVLDNL